MQNEIIIGASYKLRKNQKLLITSTLANNCAMVDSISNSHRIVYFHFDGKPEASGVCGIEQFFKIFHREATLSIIEIFPDSKKRSFTNGKWTVELSGTLIYDKNGYNYDIHHSDLHDDDWILHLSSKGWIDWNDFIPAYFQALKNKGIQNINIKTFY